MNNLYLITTAIEQSHSPHPILNKRFCISTTTELDAAAIALANQPDHTFIFSVEVYLSPKYLHALHSDRTASLFRSRLLCHLTGRKRKRHFYKQESNE
ncbi:hypothetical protein IFO70_34790 [Phormidium tenue FACHB-886]|nr:hypothetical protein [Phormidium tenue FACHB-886]